MDSKIPTSFIPKDTIRTDLRERREPVSIFFIISLFILAGSLVYLASIYVYRTVVYNDINKPCPSEGVSGSCGLKASLDIEVREFQSQKLEDLKKLDTKLKNGSTVLRSHITLRPLFDLLGTYTGANIQYQKFEYRGDNDVLTVTINGIAKSYEDIAFQQKVFANEVGKGIRDFSFSDFNVDQKGQVSFKLTLVVESSLLSYNQD
ncbi:MAG TPA: hypothetical protein P5274_02350 [Candidatus Paceibacterota bacterium]|nr:hypothetical protein [Candidatus Paceibacterota bacterium]